MRRFGTTMGLAVSMAALAIGGLSACSSDGSSPQGAAAIPTSGSGSSGGSGGSGNGSSGSTPEAPAPVRYVALGDSFVAGPGIGATGGTCQRSTRNFPSLVAKALDATTFTDASCSGATTAHYLSAQGENPPQLDALRKDTTLVTLGSMGGNDVGLVNLAGGCVFGTCGAGAQHLGQRIDALKPAIVESVAQVRERAPEARVLLVGYGTYLPNAGCAALPSVTTAEMRYLQGAIDRLSDTIKAAAQETGVEFVDMRAIPGARQHTPCAPLDKQWIRGLDGGNDGMVFHPSSAGMKQMARQVEKVLAG